MEGWIKTYRSLITHWIWKDSEYLKAWLYLLFRANFSASNVLVDKVLVPVSKGQFITSLKKLSEDTGMSIQRVRTFLKLLETDQMVKVETTSKLTKITICNYDNYQDLQHSANTVPTQCQHNANTVPTTDKNIKKEKNKKNEDNLLLGGEPPEKKNDVYDFVSDEFSFFYEWLEYKKERREKYKSKKSVEAAYNKLINLSGGDSIVARQILENSYASNYAGFFPLNNNQKSKLTDGRQTNKDAITAKLAEIERRFNGN